MSSLNPHAVDWLAAFEAHLGRLPNGERSEVVAEIRAHLLETGEEPGPMFGDPSLYAQRFVVAQDLEASPWSAVRTLVGLGRVALLGPVLVMEAVGSMLLAMAALDVVIPHNVGLFLLDGEFESFGIFSAPAGTDVLGHWIIPLAAGLGLGLVWGGFRLTRVIASRLATELRRG